MLSKCLVLVFCIKVKTFLALTGAQGITMSGRPFDPEALNLHILISLRSLKALFAYFLYVNQSLKCLYVTKEMLILRKLIFY